MENDTEDRQKRMVQRQLAGRGIQDPLVLKAMGSVARHEFLPNNLRRMAYDDRPLVIDCGQTISQPYIVARMTEALQLTGGEKVLEIGTGSGYAAAILAEIAGGVITVERHEKLAQKASERLEKLGYSNITVVCADGSKGYEAEAPYDAIIVAAASPTVPNSLTDQLKDGGRLVIPVGPRSFHQELTRVVRQPDGTLTSEALGGVVFVPLIGDEGWSDS